jgi:glycosyltransferase involved in cell wall biosynthesis
LGEAMVTILKNESLRSTLRAKGFGRVRQYTWEQAARQTLAVYQEVCGG